MESGYYVTPRAYYELLVAAYEDKEYAHDQCVRYIESLVEKGRTIEPSDLP